MAKPERRTAADEVLIHSEDEGEWSEEAEQIESRPTGTQVISARLPTVLAEELLAEAARRGYRPSDLVRQAVEAFMQAESGGVLDISAYAGTNMRVVTPLRERRTENFNLVVEVATDPERIEATA
jgi:hypothetical protein